MTCKIAIPNRNSFCGAFCDCNAPAVILMGSTETSGYIPVCEEHRKELDYQWFGLYGGIHKRKFKKL